MSNVQRDWCPHCGRKLLLTEEEHVRHQIICWEQLRKLQLGELFRSFSQSVIRS